MGGAGLSWKSPSNYCTEKAGPKTEYSQNWNIRKDVSCPCVCTHGDHTAQSSSWATACGSQQGWGSTTSYLEVACYSHTFLLSSEGNSSKGLSSFCLMKVDENTSKTWVRRLVWECEVWCCGSVNEPFWICFFSHPIAIPQCFAEYDAERCVSALWPFSLGRVMGLPGGCSRSYW